VFLRRARVCVLATRLSAHSATTTPHTPHNNNNNRTARYTDASGADQPVSLPDVCFKPFGSACATQSLLQYWQMNRTLYDTGGVFGACGAVHAVHSVSDPWMQPPWLQTASLNAASPHTRTHARTTTTRTTTNEPEQAKSKYAVKLSPDYCFGHWATQCRSAFEAPMDPHVVLGGFSTGPDFRWGGCLCLMPRPPPVVVEGRGRASCCWQ
jgi:hypothetical protein